MNLSRPQSAKESLPWIVAAVIAGSAGMAQAAPKNEVRFRTIDLRDDKGHVLCGMYKKRDHWLGDKPAYSARARIHDGAAVCVFRDVPPGEYAISALHDADDDEEMDKSALGLPEEGYCASRDAQSDGVGAPDWSDAVFEYKGGRLTLKAHMRY